MLWRSLPTEIVCSLVAVSNQRNLCVRHVTASTATSKQIINFGRRLKLVSFNMQVPCF